MKFWEVLEKWGVRYALCLLIFPTFSCGMEKGNTEKNAQPFSGAQFKWEKHVWDFWENSILRVWPRFQIALRRQINAVKTLKGKIVFLIILQFGKLFFRQHWNTYQRPKPLQNVHEFVYQNQTGNMTNISLSTYVSFHFRVL